MFSLRSHRNAFVSGFVGALAFVSPHAHGAIYHYVDWQAASPVSGTASGVITLDDGTVVTVLFKAIARDGAPGALYGAQVSTGTDYWSPATAYVSNEVENAPPPIDIVQLSGGLGHTYVLELSEPIKDPIMPILSLGQAALPTSYDFEIPFDIVSQGAGYFGGSDIALARLDGGVLLGKEGHGTLRFSGTFRTITWTVPTEEAWHGFTFGIRTLERLEPNPVTDAGVDEPTLGVVDAGAVSDTAPDPTASDAAASGSSTLNTQPNLTSEDATQPRASTADATTSVAALDPTQSDAASISDGGSGTSNTTGETLSIDLAQVTEALDAALGTITPHDDSSAWPTSDAGVSNGNSTSDQTAQADCSCRTVGRATPNTALYAFAPLILFGMAWGRRARAKRARPLTSRSALGYSAFDSD